MSIPNSGLLIGRYYFEDYKIDIDLQERIEKAARPYKEKFGLAPDTAHTNPKYCPELTIIIVDGAEVEVWPDRTMAPGVVWIGNKGLQKMPKALDSDVQIHYEYHPESTLFTSRQTSVPEAEPQLPEEEPQLTKEEAKKARRRERREARKAKASDS